LCDGDVNIRTYAVWSTGVHSQTVWCPRLSEHLIWGRMMEPVSRFTVLSTMTLTLFLFAIVTADVVTHDGTPGAAFEFVSVVSVLMHSHMQSIRMRCARACVVTFARADTSTIAV
jgi:hypothetical protein